MVKMFLNYFRPEFLCSLVVMASIRSATNDHLQAFQHFFFFFFYSDEVSKTISRSLLRQESSNDFINNRLFLILEQGHMSAYCVSEEQLWSRKK